MFWTTSAHLRFLLSLLSRFWVKEHIKTECAHILKDEGHFVVWGSVSYYFDDIIFYLDSREEVSTFNFIYLLQCSKLVLIVIISLLLIWAPTLNFYFSRRKPNMRVFTMSFVKQSLASTVTLKPKSEQCLICFVAVWTKGNSAF